MEVITDYKLLLDTAVLAGEIMLRSGAEVYRVEDTIHRMLAVSGLKTTEAYVTATGLIVTLDDPNMDSLTVVRRIRNRDTNLSQIAETNQISRRFCTGDLTLKEVILLLFWWRAFLLSCLAVRRWTVLRRELLVWHWWRCWRFLKNWN